MVNGAMTHWFVIEEGWGAGKPRLQGWIDTGIQGVSEWLGFGICPLCGAMVPISETHGNKTWAHEQWHAATDFPIPARVRERLTATAKRTASLEERVRELEEGAANAERREGLR